MVDLTTYSQGRTQSEKHAANIFVVSLEEKKTLGTSQDLRGPTGDRYQILKVFLKNFIS